MTRFSAETARGNAVSFSHGTGYRGSFHGKHRVHGERGSQSTAGRERLQDWLLLTAAGGIHSGEGEEVGHAEVFGITGFGRECGHEVRPSVDEGVRIGLEQPDEYLADDASTHGSEPLAVLFELSFPEDVEPKRRRGGEGLADLRDVCQVGRLQCPGANLSGDVLTGRQRPSQVPEEVTLRERRRRSPGGDGNQRYVEQR